MIDCDEWRRNYASWTLAEHRAFYSRVWAEYPDQSHHDAAIVADVVARCQPRTVLELGGWDGSLAVAMLDEFSDVERWTNVEICTEAVEHGSQHPRYVPLSLDAWYWERGWQADLFVASHCIEHMTAAHLEATIAATNAERLLFDAPLHDAPSNWWGGPTTHILEVGWDGVTEICARHGYRLAWAHDRATPPESGGHARACLYERQVGHV